MQVRIMPLIEFRDRKHDLTLRKPGKVYEDDEARAKELEEKGFAEIVKEAPEKKGEKPGKDSGGKKEETKKNKA